jgi:hypothetical protein
MSMSLDSLFLNLMKSGLDRRRKGQDTAESTGTTIRFDPELRKFLNAQAEAMGVSLSSMVTLILTGVMRSTVVNEDARGQADLIWSRFRQLFDLHKIDIASIAEVMADSQLTPAVVCDRDRLLDVMVDPLVETLAKKFSVNRSWLLGEDPHPGVSPKSWYVINTPIYNRIFELCGRGNRPEILFVHGINDKLVTTRNEDRQPDAQVYVFFRYRETTSSGSSYYLFESWEGLPWDYSKSRHELKQLMMVASKRHPNLSISMEGYKIPDDELDSLLKREIMPAEAFGRARKPSEVWDPEDYVLEDAVTIKEKEEVPTIAEKYKRDFERYYQNWKNKVR